MKIIYQAFGSIILAIILFLVLPSTPFIENTSDILTISTLFFTIFSGFYIATALSNYLKLQSMIAGGTSGLIALYNTCKSQQPELSEDIINAIDKYLIASFDFELTDTIPNTQKEFKELVAITDRIEKKDTSLFCEILSIRQDLLTMRQELDLAAQRIIGIFEWAILILLAFLNIALIYSIQGATIISSIISISLGFIIIFILILINLLDNNTLAEKKMSFYIFQTVFKEIGRLPYFLEKDIKSRRIMPPKEDYRIGRYKNFKKSFEKEIIVIKKNCQP